MKIRGLKKTAILLLTFFYSFCAVGLGVNVHYCHGKIASLSIGFDHEKCCCKKENKSKCCTNKEIVLKIESKQIKTSSHTFVEGIALVTTQKPLLLIADESFAFCSKSKQSFQRLYPPPCPVFLRNRNLRI